MESPVVVVLPWLDGLVAVLPALHSAPLPLESAEARAPRHPHPHGPESALGNILVGPFVAVVDRVHDTLRGRKTA
ncbi:MAG: hypothetical protein LC799_08180 [Actinobacteria bacterium]|nr:hypothetical protein [Actinomycetota bacterium]